MPEQADNAGASQEKTPAELKAEAKAKAAAEKEAQAKADADAEAEAKAKAAADAEAEAKRKADEEAEAAAARLRQRFTGPTHQVVMKQACGAHGEGDVIGQFALPPGGDVNFLVDAVRGGIARVEEIKS